MVVLSSAQQPPLFQDAAVSGLQVVGADAAGEAAQVEHSRSRLHHQLRGSDGLRTASTGDREQAGGANMETLLFGSDEPTPQQKTTSCHSQRPPV